jgi:multidrug efflux pump subunit AcrA (membrane-fusion protein)
VVLGGLGLLLLLLGCEAKAPVAAEQPVPVRVRAPLAVNEPETVAASGAVEANVTAEGAFQIAGRVARVLVDEGQPVRKDQVLAELDAADARNARDAAAAQAATAQAQERKAQAGPRSQELEQARIDYEQQRDQYTRMKFLYDHASLPANDFDKVKAAYEAAEQRYAMAKQGTRAEDKDAATGQARAAAAQLSEAEKRLGDTRLTAPIAGYVGVRRLDVGDTVAAGAPVIEVLDMDPVTVRVAIPEDEIGKVREGARAVVTIPALDGRAFEGTVDAVGVAADAASRTYTVKIAVQNAEHVLRAGMVAEARIFGVAMVRALTVPGAAVFRDEHGVAEVYVYEAGRAYARRVDVGAALGGEVEIRSGLNGDEQVVVAGAQKLREGALAQVTGGAQ